MRMKSLRTNIEQPYIKEGSYKIQHWLDRVETLIQEYGDDVVLYSDSSDNVSMRLTLGADTELAFDTPLKHGIEDNPEMTLKQWKECIKHILHVYGEDYQLYTHANKVVKFYLSAIDR